ncbi:hypothetical protein vBPaerPsCh_47 [Pseudomonas phage vB_Paer_PsCh]|uniref:Uncharacterized protein n=1 Tax=Pseudomonas phage vB_Paer_PsCh TaxID=2924906 RepID=A0AAE9GUR9_9CAUD|nr:hypothetical protein QE349_gp047 [Pseudomonas phage vB_Paer_PsCh]UOL47878.1 hypothetical protein vBPaerPsCh_47 [Pseudomonas phage vB_Paer_PsCh]
MSKHKHLKYKEEDLWKLFREGRSLKRLCLLLSVTIA